MAPEYFGTEAVTQEDRSYIGSRFSEVRNSLFANPYQKLWGGEGQSALPIYRVTLSSVLRGILSFGKNYLFREATERAVDSHADLRWGLDGKGFRRLLHPNGVCLTGMWEITEETNYSGYFRKGSRALVVGRYSTCCTETRRGYTRSLALVGKLFPTTDPNHTQPLRTASFITQQDIAGERTDYINDAELRNAPNVHVLRRGFGVPILLITGALFQNVDKEPSNRQLYQIAELGKPDGESTRSPEFMRLVVVPDQPRIEGKTLDFRDEIMGQVFDPGDPAPKRTLTFFIEVTDGSSVAGTSIAQRRTFTGWQRIGRLTFDNAVVSYNGDFVIHFNHPTWRNDRNDPSTATRVNGRKVLMGKASNKPRYGRVVLLALLFVLIAAAVIAYSLQWSKQPRAGQVKDEALLAGRDASSFKAADDDYFHDMDGGIDLTKFAPDGDKTALIRGRNTWLVWTAGNDRLWDALVYKSAGALDFLKVLSSHPELLKIDKRFSRDQRWEYFGLVNDPCFEKATGPDPERWGLWLDKRRADCKPDPFENEQDYPGVKIGSRGTQINGKNFPVGSFYGYETGIVGLRLFPNPAFDEKAARNWDPDRYYRDSNYYNDKNLIRPYRVGMSCGFCHVGPNPLKPPKDPDNPKWENLSSNVGAQYFWIDRIFYWQGDQTNFVWQLFHTSRPGSLDTSFVSTDNINNPRTMNAIYMLADRLEHARRWGKETLTGGQKNNKQLNDYIPDGPLTHYFQAPDTVWTPRVLKDGADSVGALGALNRVFLNIGAFSEEWLLHFNALVGGKPISPIEISVARKNSAYFAATEAQTPALALFFLHSTEPHHLEDLRKTDSDARKALESDDALVPRGKEVFAENCARCHSSKLPTPPPNVAAIAIDQGQGCAGKNYLDCWNKYWDWTKTDDFKKAMTEIVKQRDFLEHNYLSSELRIPVTLLQTNACSPLATNALAGNIWDNFSSQSYKDLPSVGQITWYHPYTGEPRTYQMPAGGRGYTRPPSLVSLWATAPFLLNNSVGKFNPDPSVAGRLDSFQNSIEQMLWPEKRDRDELLGYKIPGKIDRTTTQSYLKISYGYIPDALEPLHVLAPLFPSSLLDAKNELIKIGPIPRGTPVGLLANLNPFSESKDPFQRLVHDVKLLNIVRTINSDLQKLPRDPTDEEARRVLANIVDPLLEVSKCPDLIVNRGHYFGTDKSGGPGLSDADKHALIAFLKRL